jgi:hypothetical protein
MAVLGSIDLANLSVGTEVDVVGSGFTPDSPANIYECSFTPGGPVNGADGLPFDCLYIQEAQTLLTDSGGGFSGNAVIGSFFQGYFPGQFSPPPSACATGAGHVAGTCAIVVEDAAGDQARVTIGVSDSS